MRLSKKGLGFRDQGLGLGGVVEAAQKARALKKSLRVRDLGSGVFGFRWRGSGMRRLQVVLRSRA